MRWLVIAGLWPLVAAAAANAQPVRLQSPPAPQGRVLDLRLTQDPSFDHLAPPATGFIADTEVAPNTRLGVRMINIIRPKLGPEWRIDGRSQRSRKPAVSFTFRF